MTGVALLGGLCWSETVVHLPASHLAILSYVHRHPITPLFDGVAIYRQTPLSRDTCATQHQPIAAPAAPATHSLSIRKYWGALETDFLLGCVALSQIHFLAGRPVTAQTGGDSDGQASRLCGMKAKAYCRPIYIM